jgi:integrase
MSDVQDAVAGKQLTAKRIEKLSARGRYPDGKVPGLYIKVTRSGSKSWMLRYKKREMGLGSVTRLPLDVARQKALELWPVILAGRDPVIERRAERVASVVADAKAMTFARCARAYIKDHAPGWRSRREAPQWESEFARYADPIVGNLPVAKIDSRLVLDVLRQELKGLAGQTLWHNKPEVASRFRGKIERVLDWAKANKLRDGENPARWRGHLANLLPDPKRLVKPQQRAALDYREMPGLMRELREVSGIPARALEFAALTVVRNSEVIGARWTEFDLQERVWTIPAERMKARKAHKVPLCDRALELVRSLPQEDGSDFVFIGGREGKAIGDHAMVRQLQDLRPGFSVHGLRATMRTWCREQTNFPREICEAVLAHTIEGKVERAYLRGDALERRRKLMEAWTAYCMSPEVAGEVVPMRAAG